MVTIWTLSNPLQCMASPEKSINNSGRDFFIDDVPKYWLGKISIDYLCQQWFRKLIVSYLHQYQTFPVKTARSEYTMTLYYQTLSIVPYFSTFVPGNLYINGKESKKNGKSSFKWLSGVISRFTECTPSPNSLYVSHMKTSVTEMFRCMNGIDLTS